MFADPYETGVLKPEVHNRLVADMGNIAKDAAIQPHWISRPLNETCSEGEIDWVKHFRRHRADGRAGLIINGTSSYDAEDRTAAIAGALVRNFIRARVMTVNQVLQALEAGDALGYSCLLIPNFFIGGKNGGQQAPWRVSALYDLLVQRSTVGQQTVVFVSDLTGVAQEYGPKVRDFLTKHYCAA